MSPREKQMRFRKAIKTILFVAFILFALWYVGDMDLEYATAHEKAKVEPKEYALVTVVTNIDKNADMVICEDVNGFEWSFYGIEDFEIGDVAALVMCDNGTTTVFDDIVLEARYNGWIGLWEERFPEYAHID